MKTLTNILTRFIVLFALFTVAVTACKKGSSSDPVTVPVITDVQPKNPSPGDVVTITGTGFGSTQGDVKVTIGSQVITITTVSDMQIKFTLPSGLSAGDIAVIIKGITANNADPQKATITPQTPAASTATITSINPTSGKAGDIVSIVGTGFSAVTSDNVVKFNGTAASVTGSVSTVLTVTVPTGVTTGPVTLSVKSAAVITGPTFTITTSTGTGTGTAVSYMTSFGGTATFSKIATAPSEIGSMVIDKVNNVMYYSDYNGVYTPTHTGNIYKLKLDGSSPAILTSDARITKVVNLAVDASGNVYAVASLDNLGGVYANIYKIDATGQTITTLGSNVNYAASGYSLNIDSQGGVWLGYGQKLNSSTNTFDRISSFPYGSLSNPSSPGDNIYVDDVNHLTNYNVAFYKYNLLTKAGTVTDFTLQGLFKQDNASIGTGTDGSTSKYALDGSENFYVVYAYAGDASNGYQQNYVIRKTKNGNGGSSTLVTKFYNKAYSVSSPVFYQNPVSNTGILFQSDASGAVYIKNNLTDIIKITY